MRVSTAWGDVITVAPWEMYLAYGDAELLEECYPAMLKWISYIRHSGDEEYLWLGGNHYGDWLASDAILSPEHREGATQDRSYCKRIFRSFGRACSQGREGY